MCQVHVIQAQGSHHNCVRLLCHHASCLPTVSLDLDLVSGLQVTFNKSNILAPSVLNTTFFNQGGQFNTSALLQVCKQEGQRDWLRDPSASSSALMAATLQAAAARDALAPG